MKCAEQTIAKMMQFNENIKFEKWRLNFLFEWGYFNFIKDLSRQAYELHQICEEILKEENK